MSIVISIYFAEASHLNFGTNTAGCVQLFTNTRKRHE